MNRMKQLFFLILSTALLIMPSTLPAQESAVPQIVVYSTSIITKSVNAPKQISMVEITSGGYDRLDCEVKLPEQDVLKYTWKKIPDYKHSIPIEHPKLGKRQQAEVIIRHNQKVIFKKWVQLNPPKTWKIYDVQVSHHDLGYADYYHMMRRDVREMGIEMALEFCRKSDDWPRESQFRWTVETSEPMIQYLGRQPAAVINELRERIQQGRIALGGCHNSASTEHMGYEAMARQFYTPNRYVSDWLDIAPSKTALNTDIVGFTRALPLYTKEADIPYFMMGRNSAAKEFDQAEDDGAFYWQAPDKDSDMTLFKVWHYYSPDRFANYDVLEVSTISRSYEQHENWPYDCILAEDSYDFGLPQFENIEGIRKWNEMYANPVLISGTFDMFFEDLAGQQDKNSFKIYDKDAPNSWADQDLTDAEYANRAWLLNSKLPAVEKLSTIASAVASGAFPWTEIYQAYHRMLMWAEHTNGAYAEGPIYLPLSLDDKSAANATYYELEQEMHRALIREGEQFTEKAEQQAREQLAGLISTKSKQTLIVHNSLARTRSEFVWFDLPAGTGLRRLVDNTTGNVVPHQVWHDGRILFIAEDVPSVGYRAYTLQTKQASDSVSLVSESSAPEIENEYYRIVFDEKTGAIRSLFDKHRGKELVDQQASFKMNEYLYQRTNGTSYSDGLNSYHPGSAHFKSLNGGVAEMIQSQVDAEGSEKIVQNVIVYKNSNRIDFEVFIDKSPSGRTLSDYRSFSAKDKEALFYCLPFDVPDFRITHELAGGVMEPIEDQFPGSSTDFYAIQNFSDISNEEWGITLATIEPNLVEYGRPRPALWDKGDGFEKIMKKAEKSHFYLYLLNNMFFTNVRQSQPGPKRFRWSLRSHDGGWKEGKAYQFGRATANPLTTFILDGENKGPLPSTYHSFLEVDNDHIACTTIKPAEANGQGYILRFVELSGQAAAVTAKVHFVDQIQSANFTNLVEVDRDHDVDILGDQTIQFYIPAFGLRTIRVVPEHDQLPVISKITGRATADRQIKLNWKTKGSAAENVASYRIYRSTDNNFEPGLRYYVASSETSAYTDQPALHFGGWQNNTIEPNTQYHYRVVPVDKNNRPGHPSDIVSVLTMDSAQKDLAPHPVQGVYATLVSPISDHNYPGLIFYTNAESDVDTYQIYRSTRAVFTPGDDNLLDVMNVTQEIKHVTPHGFGEVSRPLKAYNRQIFVDDEVAPFTTYYYKVAAVDRAGNMGDFSGAASVTTGSENVRIKGTGSFREGTDVTMSAHIASDWEIRYTLDGSLPVKSSPRYEGPIHVDNHVTVTASIFQPGSIEGHGTRTRQFHKMKNYEVEYRIPFSRKWPGEGELTLIDFFRGGGYTDGHWQGWEKDDMDVVIDLGEQREIESVGLGCLQLPAQWIFFPKSIEVQVSTDGQNFEPAGTLETIREWLRLPDKRDDLIVSFSKTRARYVRVYAHNQKFNPEWHASPGGKSWIFTDEITIK